MNLKHFYYRQYFDGIELQQPPKKTKEREGFEKDNEAAFRIKNNILTSTGHVKPFSANNMSKVSNVPVLELQVQNPGLLPGIGYPHEVGYPGEFKLGFGFDHVSGLPLLPGSTVKGVLRSVFPQFKFDAEHPGNFTPESDVDKRAKQLEKANFIVSLLKRLGLDVPTDTDLEGKKRLAHALDLSVFCGWDFENPEKPIRSAMSKHDVCFDALPVAFEQDQLLGRDALTPHGADPLKNPIPLPFVKVMASVTFGFYFRLGETKIGALTITAEQKRRLLGEILCTVGAGAKTNVGYGQFLTLKADDRLPLPTRQAVQSGVIIGQEKDRTIATPPAAAKLIKLSFTKSLQGKKVEGLVVSEAGENPVRFRILNVEGFDGERLVKVPDSMLSKFAMNTRFNLTVTESRPDKSVLNVKVEDFIARN